MTLTLERTNGFWARLEGASPEQHRVLYDALSFLEEDADRDPRFQSGAWDGRRRLYEWDGRFPAGLLRRVEETIARHPAFAGVPLQRRQLGQGRPRNLEAVTINLRDYQRTGVAAMLENKSALGEIATGGGKTRMAIAALEAVLRPNPGMQALFLVTSRDIRKQTVDQIEELLGRAWVSELTESANLDLEGRILVATASLLTPPPSNRPKRNADKGESRGDYAKRLAKWQKLVEDRTERWRMYHELIFSKVGALAKSGAGERGIFNREGAVKTMPPRRTKRLKEAFGPTLAKRMLEELGVNPCGEIKLLSKQFCNLTMAVIRPEDSLEALKRKVRLAAILGTIQSSMTFFNYLSVDWKLNCEAERLLGVDIPGASDHPMLRHGAPDRNLWFEELKLVATKANEEWAAKLGIQPSTATTCSKPGGNSSVFLGVGHTVTGWNARHIKRHVRVNAIDPMARFLIDSGVPHWPEYDDPNPDSPNVWVFAFPLKAPETAWINDGVGAVEMLENWLAFKQFWTEHNPSITVYVRPEEWIAVGNWVYEHWDEVGGLAFLPKDDHIYPLAPITPLTKEEFEAFETSFPQIPWEKFPRYERAGDYAPDLSREYACTGDQCSL